MPQKQLDKPCFNISKQDLLTKFRSCCKLIYSLLVLIYNI